MIVAVTNALSHYQHSATETATPAQLVMMLYDGALARIGAAEASLANPDRPTDHRGAHEALVKAQMIVDELRLALDHEQGGTVAEHLNGLYAFCAEQLVVANVRKDPGPLADVRHILEGLRDAWAQACLVMPEPINSSPSLS